MLAGWVHAGHQAEVQRAPFFFRLCFASVHCGAVHRRGRQVRLVPWEDELDVCRWLQRVPNETSLMRRVVSRNEIATDARLSALRRNRAPCRWQGACHAFRLIVTLVESFLELLPKGMRCLMSGVKCHRRRCRHGS